MPQVALVCAASKGLGRASAEALARDGVRVAICARGGPALNEAADAIRHAGGEEITVREGEVLHIPSWVEHQAEALEDTFELDIFSPIRQDWLDHTDSYFHADGTER